VSEFCFGGEVELELSVLWQAEALQIWHW